MKVSGPVALARLLAAGQVAFHLTYGIAGVATPTQDLTATKGWRTGIPAQQSPSEKGGRPEDRSATAAQAPESQRCSESLAPDVNAGRLSAEDKSLQLRAARSLASCRQYDAAIERYRRFLESAPDDESILAEMAEAMLGAHRNTEAAETCRELLKSNPENWGAHLLLARALAGIGNYTEALPHYDEVLKRAPDNHDALEGKGYVLYWMHRYSEARTAFRLLADLSPDNTHAEDVLRDIERAEEESKWEALRPASEASPAELIRYYQNRLSAYPHERAAMKTLAYNRARAHDVEGAIRDYRNVLAIYPDDRDSKAELARLLGANGEYEPAIKLYSELLAGSPNDLNTLESLAHVYVWSHRLGEAAQVYKRLLATHPFNTEYELQTARLEVALKDYSAARQNLLPFLAADPKNREARLLLAQADLNQGRYRNSLEQFRILLRQDPGDFEAAFGAAQIAYYQDRLETAARLASALLKRRPENFDAVMLLASVERARHQEREALELLDRANRISPDNVEVRRLREKVREESGIRVHTSASYAREIGRSGPSGAPEAGREDLRISSFGTTLEATTLPRTISYFSLSYLPSNSPFGAIRGAVAPAEFLYRQSTEPTPFLSIRGGLGLVRFGPGASQLLPGQPDPVPAAGVRAIGFAGMTWSAREGVTVDLGWSRSPIDYTPLSVRLGVIEQRTEGGVNFFWNPQTELHLNYYEAEYSSQKYVHTVVINPEIITTNKADRDHARGGSVVLNREILRHRHFVFHAGYSGVAYGFKGARQHVFLGFFNPGFYQRHLLTTRVHGNLRGPLAYDFSAAFGLQQVNRHQALQRATILSPALTFRASRTVSLTLGYTHYNAAQSLGVVSGNAVKLSSDFKF